MLLDISQGFAQPHVRNGVRAGRRIKRVGPAVEAGDDVAALQTETARARKDCLLPLSEPPGFSHGEVQGFPSNNDRRWSWVPAFAGTTLNFPSPQIQVLEKVIALVVNDDEGRKIHDLDAPDRFHAEFGIFYYFDLLDAVLGEICRRPPD